MFFCKLLHESRENLYVFITKGTFIWGSNRSILSQCLVLNSTVIRASIFSTILQVCLNNVMTRNKCNVSISCKRLNLELLGVDYPLYILHLSSPFTIFKLGFTFYYISTHTLCALQNYVNVNSTVGKVPII